MYRNADKPRPSLKALWKVRGCWERLAKASRDADPALAEFAQVVSEAIEMGAIAHEHVEVKNDAEYCAWNVGQNLLLLERLQRATTALIAQLQATAQPREEADA